MCILPMAKLLPRHIAAAAVAKLIRPLVRFCVRHALRFQDVQEILKQAYISVGKEECGSNPSVSRLSVMSGLQRKDVVRLVEQSSGGDDMKLRARDLVTKVLGQWQGGDNYRTAKGEPRILPYSEGDPSFTVLVKEVSSDLNPASIRDELLRIGVMEETPRGFKLTSSSFAPRRDFDHGISVLADDIRDLVAAVEENILRDTETANLHARTVYDQVRADSLPEIRAWLLKEGHKFHQSIRDFISNHDQDINPKSNYRGKTAKVIAGSFSLTEVVKNEKDE